MLVEAAKPCELSGALYLGVLFRFHNISEIDEGKGTKRTTFDSLVSS
jgi:hypothetical protein